METICENEGKDLIFVIIKIMEWLDTDPSHNRFFVPNSEVLWGLLYAVEKATVEGGDGLGAVVVDPRGRKKKMKLKKWMSLNKIMLNIMKETYILLKELRDIYIYIYIPI